ncbi:MAG: hypothetical protein AAGC96_20950, partial [Pseudomonadota bacterium]
SNSPRSTTGKEDVMMPLAPTDGISGPYRPVSVNAKRAHDDRLASQKKIRPEDRISCTAGGSSRRHRHNAIVV